MFLWITFILIFLVLVMAILFKKKQLGPNRDYSNVNLEGKVVIITGASAGVGKEAAREISKKKATIIFGCRSKEKTIPVIEDIKRETNNRNLHFIELDLNRRESVHKFAEQFRAGFDRLDILINNGGVALKKQLNEDGFDKTIATNHLGHFLLTQLVMDYLIRTKYSRVVNVASAGHKAIKKKQPILEVLKGKFEKEYSYFWSKYFNVLFTQALARKLSEKNVECKAVCLHPGYVRTEIFNKTDYSFLLRKLIPLAVALTSAFTINEVEGARTTVYCALQDYSELVSGGYYSLNVLARASELCRKDNQEDELWEESVKAVKYEYKL